MPTIRPYKIIDDEYEAQSSYTIDLDLPTSGILSTLMLYVKARTLDDGLCAGPWAKYLISSISINQAGQAALNAAPPEMFEADYYYKTGKMPRRGYQVMGGAGTEVIEVIPILFGEKVDDLDYTIDLSRMNDPKLSITYDLAATDNAGSSVWDTDYYPRFTVMAHLIQGVGIPASKGYHSLRQIESYTPADSEAHKLELKGARPIKRLYCQFDKKDCGYGWIHSLDQARIYGANEAYIPFIQKCDDWQELIRELYGLCEVEAEVTYAIGDAEVDLCVDRLLSRHYELPLDADIQPKWAGYSGRYGKLKFVTGSTGAPTATVHEVKYHFKGICPWSVQPIDMEKMLGLDYLDPTEHAPVFLELKHVSNAATIGGPVNIHVSDLVTTY